jgi:glycosyltransferase involved in cell wall biosynthesis
MACGVAPLVSSIECFRDYVVDGECGFIFDHRNGDAVGALAARLNELMSRPDRLDTVGHRAVEKASHFGYPAIAGRFLNDFEILLKENCDLRLPASDY